MKCAEVEAYMHEGVAGLKRVLTAGGDPNATDPGEKTLLWMAVLNNDLEGAKLLLDAGARVDEPLLHGGTAYTIALYFKNRPMIELLLERGANPEAKSRIHLAYEERGVDGLREQLAAGADPNSLDEYGVSLLCYAVCRRDLPATRILIDAGADIEIRRPGGWTPLIDAADGDSEEIVRLLVALGADVFAKNDDGYTAYMRARMSNTSLLAFLENAELTQEIASTTDVASDK